MAQGVVSKSGLVAIVAAAMLVTVAATPTIAASKAPLGYQLMCLKTPSECKGGGTSVAKATDGTITLLKRVNAQVNAAITPRNDGADVWNASASAGDPRGLRARQAPRAHQGRHFGKRAAHCPM